MCTLSTVRELKMLYDRAHRHESNRVLMLSAFEEVARIVDPALALQVLNAHLEVQQAVDILVCSLSPGDAAHAHPSLQDALRSGMPNLDQLYTLGLWNKMQVTALSDVDKTEAVGYGA